MNTIVAIIFHRSFLSMKIVGLVVPRLEKNNFHSAYKIFLQELQNEIHLMKIHTYYETVAF